MVLKFGPPTILPIIGAGNTDQANYHHRSVFNLDPLTICSLVDNHVRPTLPLLANRRTPTLIARPANSRVSSNAKLATAAAKTLTSGHNKYNSVRSWTDPDRNENASTIVGVNNAKLAHVAPTPTQRGVIALTRSALANHASASAAH